MGIGNTIGVPASGQTWASLGFIGTGVTNTIRSGSSNAILTGSQNIICGGGSNIILSGFQNSVDDNTGQSSVINGNSNRIVASNPGSVAIPIGPYSGANSIITGCQNRIEAITNTLAQGGNCPSTWSIIGGGTGNTIYGSPAAIIGSGWRNTINQCSYGSAIVSGNCNLIVKDVWGSFIAGGTGNTVCSQYSSIAGGNGSVTTRYAQRSYSSGFFTTAGDSQHIELVVRKYAPVSGSYYLELGGQDYIDLRDGYMIGFMLNLVGYAGPGKTFHVMRKFFVERSGGSVSLGAVSIIGLDDTGAVAIATQAYGNTGFRIRFTSTADNYNWVGHLSGVEVRIP